MATGGLYGQSPTGALIAQPGTETTGLYGKSPNGSVIAQPGSESSGLYGQSPNFGGSYFEWFIFQVAAEQPATPTGGSWSFSTNTGTPPSGWSLVPPTAPTNPVWISIGLVNSKSNTDIVWSAPGVFSYSGQINGTNAPTSGIGLDGEFYIQTGVSPYAIWYKNAGTWQQVTGYDIYVTVDGNQTINGTKTFTELINGSISGNANTATYANSAVYAASANEANHALTADNATNADHATTADSATLAGNVTGIVAIANGGTGASDASTARSNLGAAASGANSDITSMSGVTGGISSPDFVQFDTGITPTVGVGKLQWDPTWGCMQVGMVGGNVNLQIGEETLAYVYNNTGSTITEGQVVKVTGSQGQRLTVALAQANSDANSATILGMATEDIPNNSSGFITTQGLVNHISTSGWPDGTLLYLSPTTPGAVTATKPQAPQHLVWIGYVVKGNTSGAGSIYIHTQNGYEIDELHDVKITNPTSGNTLIYDATQGVWVNADLTAGSGISITESAGGITISNTSPSSGGTVTSVDTAGSVSGLTLTGGPITSSGTITLGGSLDLSSPPAIGGTTPAAGTFTTLTATGQTSLGGATGSESLRVVVPGATGNYWQFSGSNGDVRVDYLGASTNIGANFVTRGSGNHNFATGTSASIVQARISHTASAVNYVQVTGAATGNKPTITAQGSDTNIDFSIQPKGSGLINLVGQSRLGNHLANYFVVNGSATTNALPIVASGSDTNVPIAIQSKGTGAIDLAAGSSGVNISNGGTVTAITRTANGSGYTSIPSVAITAPTTAGGVQATATVSLFANTATVSAGGTGYTLNDVVTLVGGTPAGSGATYTVTGVSGGVVTTVSPLNFQAYTALPNNPVSVTGGTGSGLTLTVTYGFQGATITNVGSGYVEQPTVSFSGGGGSGAAAYATVGSIPKVQTLGSAISFVTPGGEAFRIVDNGQASVSYWAALGSSANTPILRSFGSSSANIDNNAAASINFRTNSTSSSTQQFAVAHTASAVNYVQVTGAATGSAPTVSAQGSDSGINLNYASKGTYSSHIFTGTQGNQFQITGPADGSNSTNRFIAYGGKTGTGVVLGSVGSDTNISQVFQSKGTGAIDLAAGSSGVNISNGGTVTAITRTATGSGYTSQPTVNITAPTTAGGVQATATFTLTLAATPTVSSGGSGYTVGDVLTIVGGTSTQTATLTVATVSAGAVASVTISNFGIYTVAPSNPASVTGGTGTGATFNLSFGIFSATITNAGSGYVEQPTVSFSGGGGSGAAAYATVGSVTTIKSIGASTTGVTNASLQFVTPNTTATNYPPLAIRDIAGSDAGVLISPNSGYAQIVAAHATNATMMIASAGTNPIYFNTQGTSQTNQMRVAHTASAVNYVQVTGAATGGRTTISAQGSDSSVGLNIYGKGGGSMVFSCNGTVTALQLNNTSSGINYLQMAGAVAGAGPVLSSAGGDTNIDLALTPKGTGTVVANGPFTATGQTSLGGASGSEAFRATVVASQNRYVEARGGVSGSTYPAVGVGGGTEAFGIYSNLNILRFNTQGYNTGLQMAVSHTASAVNYVQVTGAATGSYPVISAQGSDSFSGLGFQSKSASILFFTRTGVQRSFNIADSVSTANYLQVQGAATTVAPILSAQGTDTNIDLTLTPKGTGYVQFGAYTANMALTVQGYIEIKDSSGTVRKLAVIA